VFDKILIANRGEIACRIARTARRLSIATVAIYSDADAQAMHVSACDEAYRVGASPPRESYLAIDRIIDIARRTGAQAIHPGYGFVSENAEFARACVDAGIVFIGPPPGAIAAMGSKSQAKRIMSDAGVPVVPGYHGDAQDLPTLTRESKAIGYPVLIKAVAGGGGKGMRAVEREQDLAPALASAQREAQSAFGDERVLIEKLLIAPRHIELQVFADMHGNAVHVFERDCSVQRRHQKVLEEAPAPGMTDALRERMGEAAVAAARSIGYVGAGTVEFIVPHTYAQDGAFYFMEMNTRLQVEHPVTEMITGSDLVEWQLRVAAGERLPKSQQELRIHGHAIEARIYAEDPARGFLPSVGRLSHLRLPQAVRVDTGVREGDVITPYYDPMIAKVIAHGADRAAAIRRLVRALSECQVAGVASNVAFLQRILSQGAFASGEVDTGLIARHETELLAPGTTDPQALVAAVLAEWEALRVQRSEAQRNGDDPCSPWQRSDLGWLNSTSHPMRFDYRDVACEYHVTLQPSRGTGIADAWRVAIGDGPAMTARLLRREASRLLLALESCEIEATVIAIGDTRHVFIGGNEVRLTRIDRLAHAGEQDSPEGHLRAPMSGTVIAVMVEAGERVSRGAALVVLEAMKMEHTITAPADGTVTAIHFERGDRVQEGADLVDLDVGSGEHA